MSFFEELKRRNVFRVGIAYVIAAWVLMQFVDLVLENIQAPDWVMQVFMLALAIGFPLAVFFAWAFEMTPGGIKKEKDVDRSQSITSQTGHKLDRSIIVALLIAVVYFAWDNFSTAPSDSGDTPTATQRTAMVEYAPKSIAVLPFVNMSTDADNEFFSDGIAEEILNVLASIPDLKVAARTSAFAYKGTNTNISRIANELGVTHILEGSVRKAGNQVRVTAQLIKADDGFHLWSANYDRELTNIFAIQDEIAGSIAAALKVSLKLASGSAGNLTGTKSIEAYEHYLKGMSLWHERTAVSLPLAIKEFETAAAIDPQFPKARAGQAISWVVISGYTGLSSEETSPFAAEAANKALSLDPENVEALAALGMVASYELRYRDSANYLKQAMAINPSYATAVQWYASTLGAMGDPEGELAMYQKAWVLDPRSRIIGYNLSSTLENEGFRGKALAVAHEVLSFAPDFPDGLGAIINFSIMDGDCSTAGEYAGRLVTALNKAENSTQVYLDLCQTENPALRASAIQTMLTWSENEFADPTFPTLSYDYDLISIFSELNEIDSAWKVLEKATDLPFLLPWIRSIRKPSARRFRCDPRVQQMIQEAGLPPAVHPVKCN